MRAREFPARATASVGRMLTRLSSRLQSSAQAHDERTLAGDGEIKWTWILAHIRHSEGLVLDVGSGNGMTALGASFAGSDVVAVGPEPEQFPFHPHGIQYVQGDLNRLEFDPASFDQILSCSSVEHVGLSGRSDASEDPEGDLLAMEKMAGLLKPDGDMVLTIPVGLDAVHAPLHRIYGEQRLGCLLRNWEIREESYWAKLTGEKYEPVTRGQALSDKGSNRYYALGLYVLGPR